MSNPNGDTEGFLAQVSVPIDVSFLRPYVRYAWAQFHRNATVVADVGASDFIVRGGSSTSSLGEMGIIIDDASFDVGGLAVLSTFRIGTQENFCLAFLKLPLGRLAALVTRLALPMEELMN